MGGQDHGPSGLENTSHKPQFVLFNIQSIELDNKVNFAFTRHDPIGVCAQMWGSFNTWFQCSTDQTNSIPWNYPIYMWYDIVRAEHINMLMKYPRAWKVAPALAVGCTIVMKPSELTPLTALVRHFSIIILCLIFYISVTDRSRNYLNSSRRQGECHLSCPHRGLNSDLGSRPVS